MGRLTLNVLLSFAQFVVEALGINFTPQMIAAE